MKFLITNGAGFVGSAATRHILENTDDSVVNVDALTYAGNLESIPYAANNSRYAFECMSICNATSVGRVFDRYKPGAVMHLAAEYHVDCSIDGLADFIKTSLVGTCMLLERTLAYWQSLTEVRKHHAISANFNLVFSIFKDGLRRPCNLAPSPLWPASYSFRIVT